MMAIWMDIVLSCNQIKQKALHISLYIHEMYDLIKWKTQSSEVVAWLFHKRVPEYIVTAFNVPARILHGQVWDVGQS